MFIKNVYKNLFYLGLMFFVARQVNSLNCYVCGDNEFNSCKNFNYSTRELYAKECLSKFHTCLAQTKGSIIVSMSCEQGKINDCKPLGDTNYCYCKTDLCNGHSLIATSDVNLPNDDEDLTEGSGYSKTPETALETTVQPPNTGDCLHSAFIIIATAALLS